MKISVCILSARDWDFTDIFQRLAIQSHADFEIVLIDYLYDHNKTAIKNLAKKYGLNLIHVCCADANYKYMRNIAGNRNKAITHASGDAVIFLDDYTAVDYDFVERHIDLLSEGILSCGMMRFVKEGVSYELQDSFGLLSVVQIVESLKSADTTVTSLYDDDSRYMLLESPTECKKVLGNEWTYTGNLGIPMDIVEDLNGFDPRLSSRGEDCDFGLRAGCCGYSVYYNPGAMSLNLPTEHIPCQYPFDHKHDLSFFNTNDALIISDKNVQKELHVSVLDRYGCKTAVCNKCGAEYILNPIELINTKRTNKEFRVSPDLFSLSEERKKIGN